MNDTDNYEDAKKMVEDAGLIDDNDGWLDVHYRKIAHLLAEVKRLYGEPRMTIDEWNRKPEGPCVTVYIDGCEYVGCLRLYKNADGVVVDDDDVIESMKRWLNE